MRPHRRFAFSCTPPRLLLGVMALSSALSASEVAFAEKVSLRNAMAPELLTSHDIKVSLARVANRGGVREESILAFTAAAVRAHLDEGQPGRVKVADMVITQPAAFTTLTHDGKPVTPLPGPEYANLPVDTAASLQTGIQTLSDGPAFLPFASPAERVMLAAMLDFAHWPRTSVETGHRWARDFDLDGFSGTQELELAEAARTPDGPVAVIRITINGRFTGSLLSSYEFKEARVRLVWSRSDRIPIKVEGGAKYVRHRGDQDDPHALNLDMTLRKRETLDIDRQELVRNSFKHFAEALAEHESGRYERAIGSCALFRERWPSSPWLPAVSNLEQQIVRRSKPKAAMSADDLKRSITELSLRWLAAVSQDDDDLEARTHRALAQLLDNYGAAIEKLTRDRDESVRALAVFAWSFGETPRHFVAVSGAVSDSSPRVRAWAANGLAVRRNPDTDPELLRRLVGDNSPEVRARGCFAAGRCLPTDDVVGGRLRDLLLQRLDDDESATRTEAARALGAVGGPADAEPLRAARGREENPDVVKQIDRALARLRKRWP